MALVVNLKTLGCSEYSNFPFISLGTFGDYDIGVSPDGIFLLEGDDDDGEPIQASIKTGLHDAEIPNLKRVHGATLQLRADGGLLFDTLTDLEEITRSYPVSSPESAGIVNRRVKTGRGVRGRNWRFGLSGSVPFELFGITVDLRPVGRVTGDARIALRGAGRLPPMTGSGTAP